MSGNDPFSTPCIHADVSAMSCHFTQFAMKETDLDDEGSYLDSSLCVLPPVQSGNEKYFSLFSII